MLFDCLMIVVRTLFIYTHAQKHISVFIRFRHAHKRNFLPQEEIKAGKVIVRMCTGRCRQILSIVVPMIFDEVQLSNQR